MTAGETGPTSEVAGPDAIRDHFRHQALACDTLGSPFTASLCRALAQVLDDSTEIGRRVLSWPANTREDALSLRLCGGLHALVLSGADPALAAVYPPNSAASQAELAHVLPGALSRNAASLGVALDSAPQTNEIARSAMLLPGFLAIARETGLAMDVHEIGSSGGLNLLFDGFAYDFGGARWARLENSPVHLAPEIRGAAVPLDGRLVIAGRAGNDIRPIDVNDPVQRLRLRSYVWADQKVRLARTDAAIALAERNPYRLERGDAAEFVQRELDKRRPDQVWVLSHSIMWQYMPQASKDAITAALDTAGEAATTEAPVAWLRMEPLDTRNSHATLSLTLWPGGETRHLARCDYHGRWIEWIA